MLNSTPRNAKSIFQKIENLHDSNNETKSKSRYVRTVRYGIETACFEAPKIWSSIPRENKKCNLVIEFEAKLLLFRKRPIQDLQELDIPNSYQDISYQVYN